MGLGLGGFRAGAFIIRMNRGSSEEIFYKGSTRDL